MRPKAILKIAVDIIMTVLALLLMAYHITGRAAHEWLGVAFVCMLIVHHMLNLQWYKGLFKGKYSPMRILNTAVNMLLLIAMLAIAVSGVMLSREVFSFLGLRLSSTGRPIHMVSTAWGFLLMSVHLGLHWGMVLGMARRMTGEKNATKPVAFAVKLFAVAIALRGIFAFFSGRMWEKLFCLVQFTFFDFDAPRWLFFVDHIAIMGLFACIAHYTAMRIRKTKEKKAEN